MRPERILIGALLRHYLPRIMRQRPLVRQDIGKSAAIAELKSRSYGAYLIVGSVRTGKTALACRLAEVFGRPTYISGMPTRGTPIWLQPLNLDDIENIHGATVILDDATRYASSRDYGNPMVRGIERAMAVRGHNGLQVIVITQTTGLLDKYLMDCDALFLKPPSLLFEEFERPAVKRMVAEVAELFSRMTELERKKNAYMITHQWKGFIRYKKPTWFTESLSFVPILGAPDGTKPG
jgi:hypothetical protein